MKQPKVSKSARRAAQRYVPVAAIALILLVLAGLWKIWGDRREFDAQVQAASRACAEFADLLNHNTDATLEDTTAWGKAVQLWEGVTPARKTGDPTGTKADCETGLTLAQNAARERDVVGDLAQIDLVASRAEAEGIDLTPLSLESTTDKIRSDVDGGRYQDAHDKIASAVEAITQQRALFYQGRSDNLASEIDALNAALNLTGASKIEVGTLINAQAQLTTAFTEETAQTVASIAQDKAREVAHTIARFYLPALSNLLSRVQDIGAVPTVAATAEFADVKAKVDQLNNSPIPASVSVFSTLMTTMQGLNEALDNAARSAPN